VRPRWRPVHAKGGGRGVVKTIARWALAAFMISAGILHFTATDAFAAIVPDYLPAARTLVYLSGAAEIGLALALLWPASRSLAGIGLILLYIAVLPANIHMAVHNIQPPGIEIPIALLWARIPFQLVFIGLAWWVSRPDSG